jgi:hypothetical protein
MYRRLAAIAPLMSFVIVLSLCVFSWISVGAETQDFLRFRNRNGNPPPIEPEWPTAVEIKMIESAITESDVPEKFRELVANPFDGDVFLFTGIGEMLEGSNLIARDTAVASMVLEVKRELHRLYYVVDFQKALHPAHDPDFYETLTDFERRAGLLVDGKFSFNEFKKLRALAVLEDPLEIFGAPKSIFFGTDSVRATGTWMLVGENISTPLNSGIVECLRASGLCLDFVAEVDFHELGGTLSPRIEYYDVAEWNPSAIRAINKTRCRQNILTIIKSNQTVTIASTDLAAEGCQPGGPLEKRRIARLMPGQSLDELDPITKFWKSRAESLKGISKAPARGFSP